jgi:DNA helicase-2/ATP-dependent DNA helicase PcrA
MLPSYGFKDTSDEDRVALMTIHLAKGLEFPHVCLLYGGRFISLCDEYEHTIRTRRRTRLFYVALTRAEHQLFDLCTVALPLGKLTDSEPSRFIEEIDAQYLVLNTGRIIPSL